MRAPNIVQQRIILLVFLVAISAALWWQNTGGSSNHPVQKFSTTPVPHVVAELDFANAEASWSGLRVDAHGNLKIDALTHSALADAIALMPAKNPELQMARMSLLLEKQFGATTSQQIMGLVPILKNYQVIEQRWWEENSSNNLSANNVSPNKPPAYEELFQLQDEVLGEKLAKTLFSEQRRLAKVMLASHQIHTDTSLTQAEKDQALMELHKTFQQNSIQEGAAHE